MGTIYAKATGSDTNAGSSFGDAPQVSEVGNGSSVGGYTTGSTAVMLLKGPNAQSDAVDVAALNPSESFVLVRIAGATGGYGGNGADDVFRVMDVTTTYGVEALHLHAIPSSVNYASWAVGGAVSSLQRSLDLVHDGLEVRWCYAGATVSLSASLYLAHECAAGERVFIRSAAPDTGELSSTKTTISPGVNAYGLSDKFLIGMSGITLRDIAIVNPATCGIRLQRASSSIQLIDCRILGGTNCIAAHDESTVGLLRCEAGNSSGDALNLGIGGIAASYVHDADGFGVIVVADGGSYITDSRIVDCGAGLGVDAAGPSTPPSVMQIAGNTIARHASDGIIVVPSTRLERVAILHNVIVENGGYGINVQTASNTYLTVDGNHFATNTSGDIVGTDAVDESMTTGDALLDGDDRPALGSPCDRGGDGYAGAVAPQRLHWTPREVQHAA